MSNPVAEPVAVAPSETQVPTPSTAAAVTTAPAAAIAHQPSIDTFLTDSASILPDALADMLPPPPQPKNFRQVNQAAKPSPAATVQPPAAQAMQETTPSVEPATAAAQPSEPTTTPTGEVATSAATASTTPEGGVTTSPQTQEDFTKNWRIRADDAKKALFLELIKNGVHPTEATREVYGEVRQEVPTAETQQQPSQAQQVNPVEQADQQISALANQLAELSTQIDEAAEKGDTVAAIKLARQESDMKMSLQRAKDNREAIRHQIETDRVNAEVNTFQQIVQGSIEAIMAKYPLLAEKNGERRAQFNAKVLQMEKDPRFGPDFRQKTPGWPEMVASMAAEQYGWNRQTQATAATPQAVAPKTAAAQTAPTMTQPAKPAPVAVPAANALRVTSAEVVSPSASPSGSAPQPGIDTFLKDSANAKPEEIRSLLANAPLHPRLLEMIRRDPRQRQLAAQLGVAH